LLDRFNKIAKKINYLGKILKELNIPNNLIQEAAQIAMSTKSDDLFLFDLGTSNSFLSEGLQNEICFTHSEGRRIAGENVAG
jgi:hypothetical protein